MGGNFKFQVQDSFLEYFFFEIWRSEKRIALSEKKSPLAYPPHLYQVVFERPITEMHTTIVKKTIIIALNIFLTFRNIDSS